MSSNDFDGPHYRPAGGREAGDRGAGANGAGYRAPEGWGNDGFWRDSSIDADYETNTQRPVPADDGTHGDAGYSYFSDGNGWQNSAATSAQATRPAPASDATSLDATRAVFGAATGGPAGPGRPGGTGGYGGPPASGGSAGPSGPWPGGPGGYGPGGNGMPGGPGGPAGPGWPGGPGGYGPGGPGGPRRPGGHAGPGRNGRRKGDWWRRWTLKKAGAIMGALVLLFILGMFGIYQYLSSTTTIPAALASANYQDTTVYYADGKTVIGTIGETNRQDLSYPEIPQQLQDAVVAAEDKNFWTEGGISPTGILRAAIHNLTSSGGGANGGSTITQEFVRGYYDGVGSQQTASRKIKEIFIAQKLASTKSKPWIMTNYLNLIYLGSKSYGVAAASETYFGKPVSELTVAQDAVLAGIIQQPSTYPLPSYRTQLKARWTYVLQQMVADKYITQAQMDAMTFPTLRTDSGTGTSAGGAKVRAASADRWAPYILEVVDNELTSPTSVGGDGIPQTQVETGGLKIVTTISYKMESEIYKAVDANIAAIKATPGAQFPSYVRIGAELQNPGNGEIIAMYPGPGQSMTAKQCAEWDCDLNTAIYTREQVGSSFKPYVLSAAVADGMNVQTSTLNANTYLCVPKDTQPMILSKTMKYYNGALSECNDNGMPGYFPVENDGGEVIGDPKKGGGATVQDALAQSSNTAFTDLTHRVTTTNVVRMAKAFGVSTADYPTGSGLGSDIGDTNIALGIAPLTVNEQATMLSAIANNGVYHQAHIIKYWQQPDGPEQKPQIASHGVLDPSNPVNNAALDSQVQYAMSMTTVNGTGTAAAYGLGNRPIIAKTGTTSSYHAGFFIGAIPQYSLVVGMFTKSQDSNSPQTLQVLSGGGYGGYWPAKIWNTFAQAEFANLPMQSFQNAVFSGANWNQIGKITPPQINCWGQDGKKHKMAVKTCPTPDPQQSCTYDQQTGQNDLCSTCTFDQETGQFDNCTDPQPTQNGCTYDQQTGQFDICNGSPTPSNSATCQFQGDPTCPSDTATPSPTDTSTATTQSASATQAGFAIGGGLVALPGAGSVLWGAKGARRRRRKRRAGTAK